MCPGGDPAGQDLPSPRSVSSPSPGTPRAHSAGELSEPERCHTCRRRVQLTLGDRRDAHEPCRAILGRVPAPAPFPCPFWLVDTAGWKNSVGMGRSGLEASGEKGLGGAAGERGEGAGEQAQAGPWKTGWQGGGYLTNCPSRSLHVASGKAKQKQSACMVPGRAGRRQRNRPLGSMLCETGTDASLVGGGEGAVRARG